MKNSSKIKSIFCLLLVSYLSADIRPAKAEEKVFANLVFPIVAGKVTSNFGTRRHPITKTVKHHDGIDIGVPSESYVRTVARGVVVFAGRYSGYGNLVTILHAEGYTSHYGHLNSFSVKIGESLKPGDVIGRVGRTGRATGPHLHFEWRLNGNPIDPNKILPILSKASG